MSKTIDRELGDIIKSMQIATGSNKISGQLARDLDKLCAAAYRNQTNWTPICSEADLHQPHGLYWITYVSDGKAHVGSDRIYLDDQVFAANTVAFMKIAEPEPYADGYGC